MSWTAGEIAQWVSGELRGNADTRVDRAASLENCAPDSVIYVDSPKRLQAALDSTAVLLLVENDCPAQRKTTIAVANPKLAFAQILDRMFPPQGDSAGIHPTALVARSARLASSVGVGPYAVVEASAEVGERTRIGAHCVIGQGARIGCDCRLLPRVVLYPGVTLQDRVVLHAGCVVGSDGFGYVREGGVYHKFPQLGTVVIEEDVEIGANSCIDRGALDATTIGKGTKIDNLVQVAHNVRIGRNVVIAAQTGVSGSCVIEDDVVIAGQVGLADHVRIEREASIGAQAGVPSKKIIRRGQFVWGTPARPMSEFSESHANIGRIPRLRAQIRELEKRLEELREQVAKNESQS